MESHCAPIKPPKSDRKMKQAYFFIQPQRINEFITAAVCVFLSETILSGNDSVLALLQILLLCLGKVLLQVCLNLSSQQTGANICLM